MKLRPYQNSSINTLRNAFRTNKRVLFVLPTGGGKTAIFTYIANSSNKNILILAHRKELIEQITERLGNYDTNRIKVGMVQTVVKNLDKYNSEFIIMDEAHHAVAGSWEKIMNAYNKAYVLGVTATPCRLDGKGLANAFDCMVEGPTITNLINEGYLCKAKTYASAHDLSKIKTVAGDYNKSQLADYFNKSKITGDAIEAWRNYAYEKQTIVFCINIEHAISVSALFNALGYKSEVISSKNGKDERDKIISNFRNGITTLLISVDIISEGFDVPSCEAVILLRPTKSLALYMQQVGRALRTSPGKSHAIILDHAGNCFRHGLATEEREWELTHNKVKAAQQQKWQLRQCENCFAIISNVVDKCPECGNINKPAPKEMKLVAGELIEVDKIIEFKKQLKREEWNAKTLNDWQMIAKKRGYNEGWAFIRYQQRLKR
jgi:superfamily II DNA or RNA helicase